MNTAQQNENKFTKFEIKRANNTQDLFKKIGCPRDNEFIYRLQNNIIYKYPIIEDIKIVWTRPSNLEGKNTKGKTICNSCSHKNKDSAMH